MTALIVIGAIICSVVAILIICNIVKKKRINYVSFNSPALAKIKEINKNYQFDTKSSKDLIFRFYLNSKAKFDRFLSEDAIKETFFENQIKIKNTIEKVSRERISFKKYQSEISNIETTDFSLLPKTTVLNDKKYFEIEKKLFNELIKKPYLNASVYLEWSYTSPAGRNYYEDDRTLNYDEIVKYYFNFYGVDLSKVEENDRLEQAIKQAINSMVGYAYSIPQIINIYKSLGIKADERLAMTTAAKAGFIKNRKSDIYVKESVGSVNDLILCSSDSTGLIHYENTVKNEEYDNAITSLEKDRKIVPISNLLFLKLDKSLSYNGLSFDDIKEFDKLVREFSLEHKYFSVKSIFENVKCKVTESSFDDCFIYNLLKYNGFLHEIPCLEKMFTANEKPTRLKFLTYLVGSNKSVNAFDLIQALKKTYGVDYTIYSIIYDIDKNRTKLYYNSETEKIYSDKEYFYEEIL